MRNIYDSTNSPYTCVQSIKHISREETTRMKQYIKIMFGCALLGANICYASENGDGSKENPYKFASFKAVVNHGRGFTSYAQRDETRKNHPDVTLTADRIYVKDATAKSGSIKWRVNKEDMI